MEIKLQKKIFLNNYVNVTLLVMFVTIISLIELTHYIFVHHISKKCRHKTDKGTCKQPEDFHQ